jgi:hypothetical protein
VIKAIRYSFLSSLILLISSCGPSSADKTSPFTSKESEQGLYLYENGKAVFFYRREPKTLGGEYVCNNYLHPLFAPNGDTLTEESPADHPYHRGIYWSWHQHYINGMSLGDGWVMEDIAQEVVEMNVGTYNDKASLDLTVLWKSPNYEHGKAYIKENTSIVVHQLVSGIRMIDFDISLQALVPGVSLGGSDDEKGYGGLCTRIKLPDDLVFTSTDGKVTPKTLQIIAGPWMDFSGTFRTGGEKNGLAILCHPDTPNYPAPWILRQKTSMQNIVFPGRDPVEISMDHPTRLKYRLVLHTGTADDVDLVRFQSSYGKGRS